MAAIVQSAFTRTHSSRMKRAAIAEQDLAYDASFSYEDDLRSEANAVLKAQEEPQTPQPASAQAVAQQAPSGAHAAQQHDRHAHHNSGGHKHRRY